MAQWIPAFAVEDLQPGAGRLFRHEQLQIAVFRLHDDEVYAVDNLCPHEGYPLIQGYVKDCVLTCAWHNFKFDLRDGACVLGDEAVRWYPVRRANGHVEVDVSEPDRSREIPRLLQSLEEGLLEHSMGRVARDVVRLLRSGLDPAEVAFEAARFDARFSEYGTTHALPVAADCLRYFDRYPQEQAVLPILQALEMASFPSIRRPLRPPTAGVDAGSSPAAAEARLLELVEAEKGAEAEGAMVGALERGWTREQIEPWFFRLCAQHFTDFGHQLIYAVKAFDLLHAVGWERAVEILPAMIYRTAHATREDTLPPWGSYRKRLKAAEPSFEGWWKLQAKSSALEASERTSLRSSLLEDSSTQAFDTVASLLAKGRSTAAVVDEVTLAAAERMLRFDLAIDGDATVQEGWLDVTHPFTFASAVRQAVQRFRDPDVFFLIFQAVRFVNHARPLDQAGASSCPASRPELAEVHQTLVSGTEEERNRLQSEMEDLALSDRFVRPIVVAHVIKVVAAAFDEFEHLKQMGHDDAYLPVLAANRFGSAPVSERRIRRAAHEAVGFVAHRKLPRRLT